MRTPAVLSWSTGENVTVSAGGYLPTEPPTDWGLPGLLDGLTRQPLTVVGCTCCTDTTTRAEMAARHGTPTAFEAALERAAAEISHGEASAAALSYRRAYEAAPESQR